MTSPLHQSVDRTTRHTLLVLLSLLGIENEGGKLAASGPMEAGNVLFGRDITTTMAADRRRGTLLISLLISLLITQISAKSSVIDLDEDNWHQMLEGEWMVEL
ncbi:hypothetical protein E2C01_002325 [Portunus trituberculatus]|uniref:Uncharacterized protein n=1 Tax=Portunus trituberculatus TaxID=210409 RepID=A0A5B7CMZ6_PORTR|nr:hypothetical protein [Portunus trituberculatus]